MSRKSPLQHAQHQALVHHKAGRLAPAIACYRRILTLLPLHADANAHNNLAHTLLALGDYAQALASSRKALAIDPTLSAALQHEAQALVGMLK